MEIKTVAEVRGLMLILSKEIAVIVPKNVAEIPSSYILKTRLAKTEEKKEASDKRIKEVF
jgi:hypothetical protein